MNVLRLSCLLQALLALGLAGCGGRATQSAVPSVADGTQSAAAMAMKQMPASVSPARVSAPPMARTAIQSSSTMSSLRPESSVQPLGFTQLPGAGVFVTASPDGSIWVLSTLGVPTGDKLIYHYQNGTWTNIPGAALRIASAPDNSLWAVNAAGGIYHYVNGNWSTIAGGASDLAVGADGSLFVVSNQAEGPYGYGIYHYSNGIWTQLPGAGVRVSASWDTGSYSYNIAPGGFYIVNAQLSLFYYNPSLGFTQIPGAAIQLAPTTTGGLFVLGVPNSPNGNPIYYNDLSTGTWTQQSGAGVAIATNTTGVYVIGANNGIYHSPAIATGGGTPLSGPSFYPPQCTAAGPGCAWAATSVANALQYPVQSGYNGSGQTIAIIVDSAYNLTDRNAYLAYSQTPSTSRTISTQLIDGASASPNSTGVFEASLDVETIAGLAPGANVVSYVVPQLTTMHEIDALNTIITTGQAHVVSMLQQLRIPRRRRQRCIDHFSTGGKRRHRICRVFW
jgi:hypothetical protein